MGHSPGSFQITILAKKKDMDCTMRGNALINWRKRVAKGELVKVGVVQHSGIILDWGDTRHEGAKRREP
jgi:hypothetical protein